MPKSVSEDLRDLMAKIDTAVTESTYWGEVNCGKCGTTIGYTTSSEPRPSIYCPQCTSEEKDSDY